MGCTHGSLSRKTTATILANTKTSGNNSSRPISQSAANAPLEDSPSNPDNNPPFNFQEHMSGCNATSFAPYLDASRPETRFAREQNKISLEPSDTRSIQKAEQKKNFIIVKKEKNFSQLLTQSPSSNLRKEPYLFNKGEAAEARDHPLQPTEPTCLEEDEVGSYCNNKARDHTSNVAAPTVLRRRLQKESDSVQSGIFGNIQDYEKFVRRMSSKMVISRQKRYNLLEGSKQSVKLRACKTLREGKTLPLSDSQDLPIMSIKNIGAISSGRKIRTGEFRLLSTIEKKRYEPPFTIPKEQDSPVDLQPAKTERQFSKATEALKKKLGCMVRSGMLKAFRSNATVNCQRTWDAAPEARGMPLSKNDSPANADQKDGQPKLNATPKGSHLRSLYPPNQNSAADLSTVLNLLQSKPVMRLEGQ